VFGIVSLLWSNAASGQRAIATEPTLSAGCYQLTIGAWSRSLGVNAKYHLLPVRVQLDTAPGPGRGWKLTPDIVYPYPHRFPAPLWRVKGDSVELVWSNGFQPTWIRAKRQSNGELIGEAEVGSDTDEFGGNPPRARVVAHSIACPVSR
jgi:hypothetical protein